MNLNPNFENEVLYSYVVTANKCGRRLVEVASPNFLFNLTLSSATFLGMEFVKYGSLTSQRLEHIEYQLYHTLI